MTSSPQYVTEIPTFPEEVNLSQAIGLIPKIAQSTTEQSIIDRLRIHDPVIRVFSLATLIQMKRRFDDEILTVAMHVAQRSAYIRQLLVPELLTLRRFDLIEKLMEMEGKSREKTAQVPMLLMKSEQDNDYAAQVQLLELMYLQTGNIRYLEQAAEVARGRLFWKDGVKCLLRMVFMQSKAGLDNSLLAVTQVLDKEGARKEFLSLVPIINSLDECKIVRSYVIAMKFFWGKNYQKCVDFLLSSNALEITRDKLPLLSNIAAKCYEELGQYQKAAEFYAYQSKAQIDDRFSPQAFIDGLNERAAIQNPQPLEDRHDNYFIMTGFPRSGTTLLENALNAHPLVATCEETSSLIGSFAPAFSAPMERDPERKKGMVRLAYHQKLYYENLDRYVKKPDAKAIIDKTPIISANIKYMEKIFPNKRYIFSIRHPYDVVLSNYKQVYTQNGAMAAFNDIYDACVLYNKVMSDWFEVFPDETDRVCYIKYDDLVNNFKMQMERALDFLGVGWTDEVMNFVEHSQKRAVRTPSYENVRKGLTIGVQTSWQNFNFLFDEKCLPLLDPWVKRFGYSQ